MQDTDGSVPQQHRSCSDIIEHCFENRRITCFEVAGYCGWGVRISCWLSEGWLCASIPTQNFERQESCDRVTPNMIYASHLPVSVFFSCSNPQTSMTAEILRFIHLCYENKQFGKVMTVTRETSRISDYTLWKSVEDFRWIRKQNFNVGVRDWLVHNSCTLSNQTHTVVLCATRRSIEWTLCINQREWLGLCRLSRAMEAMSLALSPKSTFSRCHFGSACSSDVMRCRFLFTSIEMQSRRQSQSR